LLDVSVTTVPPAGAGTAIWMLPWTVVPPTTEVGEKDRVTWLFESTVNVAVADWPPNVPVIVTAVSVPTFTVVTANVAVVAPAATVTEAGTFPAALLDDRVTVDPPGGAGADNVTVPVEPAAPVTVVGFRLIEIPPTVMLSVAVGDPPLAEAVMMLVVADATPSVVTVNVPVVAPAATVIVAGTVAAEVLLDCRLTVRPPDGAGLLIVTVPVDFVPPGTEVGLSVRPVAVGAVIVKDPEPVDELDEAVIVAVVFAETASVVTAAVPVVAPAAIVIEAGTVAAGVFEERLTT
jgi:hypothetical protein